MNNIPLLTRVRHIPTGRTGHVARYDYPNEPTIAADEPFEGRGGLLADGFYALEKDLEIIPHE